MTIEIVHIPIKNGESFHSYVTNYQRVPIASEHPRPAIASKQHLASAGVREKWLSSGLIQATHITRYSM